MMRADARRNRERILMTALELFTERGPGVSMEEIAQTAGLGVGTLYRHFPDRRAMVEELAEITLEGLQTHIRGRLEERPETYWALLLDVMNYCAWQPLSLIVSLAGSAAVPPSCAKLWDEVGELLAEIAGRAQQEGSMRRDLTPEQAVDVLYATVCRPASRFDGPLTTVVLDGLRATARQEP
ncbi:TetR/AcrR family transcriptional regulator [Nonomuraea maritima]|uniref:TetR/AcrR family transcriptional regulator n=1 Tax=Nonomuraea maritima TaxID=683260 RepID=UPI0037173541